MYILSAGLCDTCAVLIFTEGQIREMERGRGVGEREGEGGRGREREGEGGRGREREGEGGRDEREMKREMKKRERERET